ncbi:putative integral membrane protein [Mycobacterium tuberculosis RGTB423]|nr:putative integral membrane protein [Mycobacterium tuberculosis RGTB423]
MSETGQRESVRPSPIFLGLLGLTAVGGALAWLAGETVQPLAYAGVFVMVIAGWLVSLCLHEFGHAFTAWRFGDHDVAVRGYLTLDPRRYSHPMLSLGLPMLFIALGGIGLPGAAVYVHTWFMTTARRTLVSLAGPTVNLALAMLLLAATRLLFDPIHAVLWAGVAFLAFLQLTALVLNLLPIPGLDGYAAPGAAPETRDAARPGAGQAVRFGVSAGPVPGADAERVVFRGGVLALRPVWRVAPAGRRGQRADPFLEYLVLTVQSPSAGRAAGSQSSSRSRQRPYSSVSPIAAAARASAATHRRKPRLGWWEYGTGPKPFQPWRRSWSRPRWYPVRAYA